MPHVLGLKQKDVSESGLWSMASVSSVAATSSAEIKDGQEKLQAKHRPTQQHMRSIMPSAHLWGETVGEGMTVCEGRGGERWHQDWKD